ERPAVWACSSAGRDEAGPTKSAWSWPCGAGFMPADGAAPDAAAGRCANGRRTAGLSDLRPKRLPPPSGLGPGLFRALPAFDVALRAATHRQGLRRHVLGAGGAGAGGGARAQVQRRHQRAVGADEHVLAHHRAVLVGAVVVAGDGAGADVGARTDLGVAQVAQVTG